MAESGWNKREPVSNLVILGDADENATKASGLLARVVPDTVYKERNNYELVQKNGESVMLAGSASLSRQIGQTDVGHFIKATFKGWGKSANGKFKDIEVLIYEGEPTPDMKAWPRWKELNSKSPKPGKSAPVEEDETPPEEHIPDLDEDDDLPFDS